jgi:hypothetical protein
MAAGRINFRFQGISREGELVSASFAGRQKHNPNNTARNSTAIECLFILNDVVVIIIDFIVKMISD